MSIIGLEMHQTPPLFFHEDETGALCIYWTNPYNGKHERIAYLFWPEHPAEVTEAVEAVYDFFGRAFAASPQIISALRMGLQLGESGQHGAGKSCPTCHFVQEARKALGRLGESTPGELAGRTDSLPRPTEMLAVLRAADYTLSLHGHIDADTPLHKRIRAAIKNHNPARI